MHGAAQVFRRAREIGAGKNVSFGKKNSVRFKISLQKVLKLKKNPEAHVAIMLEFISSWAEHFSFY